MTDAEYGPPPPVDRQSFDYDLFVIGSGPAGQRAAIQAAKAGARVAVAERMKSVGGICLHQGTIPSKTFREAALHLSGFRERSSRLGRPVRHTNPQRCWSLPCSPPSLPFDKKRYVETRIL